jgi:predicted DNA-binding transcriptional regulator YafY
MAKKIDLNRLRQLKLLLTWEGRISNSRLRELFGLSSIRASQWIRELRDQAPDWLKMNSVERSFDATQSFYAHENGAESNLDQYLSIVGLSHAMNSNGKPVVAAFPDITIPNPRIFSVISIAARTHRMVEITYRSMSEPQPHKRRISPHSIVHAGRRWHVRAYCSEKMQFRDYALGRIVDAKLMAMPSEKLMGDDKAWMTEVQVRLVAHPDLTPDQESVIRFEYFKNTSARVVVCRGALVSYFIQDIRAAIDTKKQCAPDYQLAVSNIKEVEPWLFPR